MRILHVLGERGFSGGEVQLELLLEHLVARGHDNLLLLQPKARFAAVAARLQLPVTTLRMRNPWDPLAVVGLRRAIRAAGADLVHFACSRSHQLGAFATLRMPLPPRVATRRMDYPLRHGALSRWIYAGGVHRVVAISAAVRHEILRVGVPAEQVELIHEGVPIERFARLRAPERRAAARRALALPPAAPVVACAAALRPRKGQLHLVRAHALVRRTVPDAVLLLAGDGSERATLEAEVQRLGLGDAARLPGRVAAEDVLAAADLACMPSLLEGLSVFTLEAQAAGLPVVASAVGGLPEAVADGTTGRLVPPGRPEPLAGAIAELLTDVELRERMGRAAAERAATVFSAARMGAATEACYARLVESCRGDASAARRNPSSGGSPPRNRA